MHLQQKFIEYTRPYCMRAYVKFPAMVLPMYWNVLMYLQILAHSSGYAMINYKIANYLPRGSTHVPLPPHSILAGVVQSMVQSGWVGPFQINSSSHMGSSKLSAYATILQFFSNFQFSDLGILCVLHCIYIYTNTPCTHT